jgi:hypothetical protein
MVRKNQLKDHVELFIPDFGRMDLSKFFLSLKQVFNAEINQLTFISEKHFGE